MKNNRILDYCVLYFAFVVYSISAIFAKLAAVQETFLMAALFLLIELLVLFAYALIWQQALKKFTLVVAMANKGTTVIMCLIWSVLIFNETITAFNMIGATLVLIGVWLVSSDD